MYGNFTGYPYVDYTLKDVDWLGSDMNKLAAWCLITAGKVESFYGETLTAYVTGKGKVLNAQGGAIFVEGIPELDTVLPNIFETAIGALGGTPGTYTPVENPPETMWGPYVTETLAILGNTMGVSGSTVGAILFFAMYILVGALTFPTGHTMMGIAVSFPLIVVALYTGFIPLGIGAALLGVSVILLVRQVWFTGG